jgi:hypothetical protein
MEKVKVGKGKMENVKTEKGKVVRKRWGGG